MSKLRSAVLWLFGIVLLVAGAANAADDQPGSSLLDRLKATVKPDQSFELLVRIKLKPGTEERFAAEATKVAKETVKEPGNEMFVFYKHLEQPGTVILFEKWKNLAALEAHQKAAHTVPWLKFTGEIGVEATIGILGPLESSK
jgi:quinol monooxygenase YgiN